MASSTYLEQIPALRRLPLIGNAIAFRSDCLALFERVLEQCGDIGVFHVGSIPVVMLNAAEYVHAVLVEHAADVEKIPLLNQHLEPLLGQGLLTSKNVLQKRQRRLIGPAFQHRRVITYAETVVHDTESLQRGWAEGVVVDVAHEMMGLTLGVVSKALFGTDVTSETQTLGEAFTIASTFISDNAKRLVPRPVTWPTPRNHRFWQAIAALDGTIARMIVERRRSGGSSGDLLSMLLQVRDEDDGSSLSDAQLHDEIRTLLFTGHETTANALAWSWYLLSRHSAVYAHMQDELDRVLGGRAPAWSDLPDLPYCLQVFKEAMRLYPPAYITGRITANPIVLGKYHLPPNTCIGISPYVVHRRADYFAHPERFDPERFTPEAEKRLPRCAYLPFGAGPRSCVGSHFAMMEGQLILATLGQRITLEPVTPEDVEPEPLITLRPRGGVKLRVRRRAAASRVALDGQAIDRHEPHHLRNERAEHS